MKHGPIALIDENMPVAVIATRKGHYEKVKHSANKSRKGKIIGIVTEGDETVKALADHAIEIPEKLLKINTSTNNYSVAIVVISHCIDA